MPWVITLLHRNHAQRAEHIFVHNINDTARSRHQVNAERVRDGLHRFFRALAVKLERSAQQIFGKIAQYHIGVGHGWRFPALAISNWPRNSASRLRANAQGLGQFRHISDRAATCTNGFDIKR